MTNCVVDDAIETDEKETQLLDERVLIASSQKSGHEISFGMATKEDIPKPKESKIKKTKRQKQETANDKENNPGEVDMSCNQAKQCKRRRKSRSSWSVTRSKDCFYLHFELNILTFAFLK